MCVSFIKLAIQGRRGRYLANGDVLEDNQTFAVEVDEAYQDDYLRQGAALFVNSISEETSSSIFSDRLAFSFAHELAHLFIIGRNSPPFDGGEHILSGVDNLMNVEPSAFSNCKFHESEITHTDLRQRASVLTP